MSSQTMSPPKQSQAKDSEGQSQNSKTPKQSGGIQQNIGTIDRYVRLTAGLFLVGSALSSRKQGLGSRTLLAFGAMSAAEGILGWCPLMHLLGIKAMTGALEAGKPNKDTAKVQAQDKEQQEVHGNSRGPDGQIHDQSAVRTEGEKKSSPDEEVESHSSNQPHQMTMGQAAYEDAFIERHLQNAATADINTSFQ